MQSYLNREEVKLTEGKFKFLSLCHAFDDVLLNSKITYHFLVPSSERPLSTTSFTSEGLELELPS